MIVVPLLVLAVGAPRASTAGPVYVLELEDTIQPASLRYIERGLEEANSAGASVVVIELDTPGGLLDSLRAMTSAILASPVPVVVYVTPSGARAASAGFFLLLAADVAAMAPGTNTGAAHPVSIGSAPQREDGSDERPSAAEAPIDKAVKDAAALARSLAERRKRSVELAEQAVTSSASFTAEEARARGLVDVIAIDREQLLQQIDGRTVTRFDGSTQTLQLSGAEVIVVERTIAERVLTVIASPEIAYLLMMLGAIGILIELTTPGGFVPGIVGTLAVLLGLYGLSVLPVTVTGALLVVVGLALLVAEVFVTSYGVLATVGLAAFVIGSLILVDAPIPELQIGPEVVIPSALVLAGVIVLLAMRALRSRREPVQTGAEGMVGETGDVVDGIAPDHEGTVFVHGELWTASARLPLSPGEKVRVDAVEGLRLRVSPLQPVHEGTR